MERRHTITSIVVIALLAAAATIGVERLLQPSSAQAQQPTSPLTGVTVLATGYGYLMGGMGRRDVHGFTFINQQTGDIWVYLGEDLKAHYRVAALGQKLQEVK